MLENGFKKKNIGEKSVSANSNSGGGDHGDTLKKLGIFSGLYLVWTTISENIGDFLS